MLLHSAPAKPQFNFNIRPGPGLDCKVQKTHNVIAASGLKQALDIITAFHLSTRPSIKGAAAHELKPIKSASDW